MEEGLTIKRISNPWHGGGPCFFAYWNGKHIPCGREAGETGFADLFPAKDELEAYQIVKRWLEKNHGHEAYGSVREACDLEKFTNAVLGSRETSSVVDEGEVK